jgi:hypothetical protein
MKRIALLIGGLFCWLSASIANAQPGALLTEEHKIFKTDVGAWDTVMKIYPQGPDGPAIESKGEETNQLLGNGMWLLSFYKGDIGGTAFEGHGTFGYDPKKKKYTGTWIDNMKPTMDTMEGDYDPKTKTLTMYSESIDPETGKPMKMKNVGKFIDNNTRTFTMYTLAPGTKDQYVKMMEIHYTRKKKTE